VQFERLVITIGLTSKTDRHYPFKGEVMAEKSVHFLFSKRHEDIEGETWMFYCPCCGYRLRFARFYYCDGHEIDLLDRGDAAFDHFSSEIEALLFGTGTDEENGQLEIYHEEEWLSRAALQAIQNLGKPLDPASRYPELDCNEQDEQWAGPELRSWLGQLTQELESDF
jgi:hypothetical protein